jgi:hypothetical protein
MPVVASQRFWWFSGPGERLRVVLRVVLGSETWAVLGCSGIDRYGTAGCVLGYEATNLPGTRSDLYPQ